MSELEAIDAALTSRNVQESIASLRTYGVTVEENPEEYWFRTRHGALIHLLK